MKTQIKGHNSVSFKDAEVKLAVVVAEHVFL